MKTRIAIEKEPSILSPFDGPMKFIFYIGCGISILMVVALGAVSYYSLSQQKKIEKWVEHSYQVISAVDSINLLYHNGILVNQHQQETPQTDPVHDAGQSKAIAARVKALKLQVFDNNLQVMRVIRVQRLFNEFFQEEKSQVTANEQQKIAGDALKSTLAIITEVEQTLLRQRKQAYLDSLQTTQLVVIAGTSVILLIVAFLIAIILKEQRNRYKAYQKEQELNRLKSNFVTLASHEFRTPLSAILLSVSLIEKYIKSCDAENLSKHCRKIKTVVHSLKDILEDFLSLENLDAGRVKAIFEPFDLAWICDDVIEEMQMIAGPGQTLRHASIGTELMVNLDKNLLRTAIINLLTNSINYAGEHAVIVLQAEFLPHNIIISVKDNGIGIEKQDQERLFTPFYRINNTGSIPGTGLGLNIAFRYVQLMGGELSFSSTQGRETCFKMNFPVRA